MYWSRDSPVAHGKGMVKKVAPLQPMEDHGGAEARGGSHAKTGGCALKEVAAS